MEKANAIIRSKFGVKSNLVQSFSTKIPQVNQYIVIELTIWNDIFQMISYQQLLLPSLGHQGEVKQASASQEPSDQVAELSKTVHISR